MGNPIHDEQPDPHHERCQRVLDGREIKRIEKEREQRIAALEEKNG